MMGRPVSPGATRRSLLQAAWALALQPWRAWGAAARTAQALPWATDPFVLGVASGAPRPDGVTLWTRLMPQDHMLYGSSADHIYIVSYEIYGDAALKNRIRAGAVPTDGRRGHSVHVVVRGLEPATPYWYRFACHGAVSRVGRTRTAPAQGAPVTSFRLAMASCQHYEQGAFTAHRDMADRELDAVLFLGDYLYEAGHRPQRLRDHPLRVAVDLTEYRQLHAHYKQDTDLQDCHAAHPWLLMWDDHEVVNDYANDADPFRNPREVFMRRRAAAYQAYFEHMPLERPWFVAQGEVGLHLHDRYAWGSLADVWTLDGRQYRSHHACPDPVRGGGRMVLARQCADMAEPTHTMLGLEQEAWIERGLAQSTAHWKLVGQPTLMSTAGIRLPVVGPLTYTDGWDGYPLARDRFLKAIETQGVSNVVVLGGDVHTNFVAALRREPGNPEAPILATEFVTTSVTSSGMFRPVLDGILLSNPDVRYGRTDERGYGLMTVTPDAVHCEFRSTPHPARAGVPLQTQAVWAVRPGRAGPVRVA
jgi:alkaline phosphatase D